MPSKPKPYAIIETPLDKRFKLYDEWEFDSEGVIKECGEWRFHSDWENGDAHVLARLERLSNMNIVLEDYSVLLTVPVRWGWINSVRYMLEHGAKPDGYPISRNPPIYFTNSSNSNLDVVKVLVGFGANVNIQNAEKRTSLMNWACDNTTEGVEYLLSVGADPLIKDFCKLTAVDHARQRKKWHNVELLESWIASNDSSSA